MSFPTITMPAMPGYLSPASFEWQRNVLTGATVNPFTGQRQIFNWNASYLEGSVSLPPMPYTSAAAEAWRLFLMQCSGQLCQFAFPSVLYSLFPDELSTNSGTTPRYFQLKTGSEKWTITKGQLYNLTFEIREAI